MSESEPIILRVTSPIIHPFPAKEGDILVVRLADSSVQRVEDHSLNAGALLGQIVDGNLAPVTQPPAHVYAALIGHQRAILSREPARQFLRSRLSE